MRTKILNKSYGQIILMTFGTILFFLAMLLIYYSSGQHEYVLYISGCILVGLVGYLIYMFTAPKVLIECDDNNLILHFRKKEIAIPLIEIISCTHRLSHARNMTYPFGDIIIKTAKKKYITRNGASIIEASNTINTLLREHYRNCKIK